MLSRRRLLLTTAAAVALAGTRRTTIAAEPGIRLTAGTRIIEVAGRAAQVLGLTDAVGARGLVFNAGDRFALRLINALPEETLIHWHGLTPPTAQDGTPGLSQPPLPPGASHDYDFPLDHAGTHWMHSHVGLQEQRLLAAPLILRDPAERGLDEQEVVVMLHDFTFRDPAEIMTGLQLGSDHAAHAAHEAPGSAMTPMPDEHDHDAAPPAMTPGGGHDHAAMLAPPAAADCCVVGEGMTGVHLNDIEHDAFLANDRTLDDPEVVRVEPGGRVRLRLINGAAATNFFIDLGSLDGMLIAVDGNPVRPISGRRFPIAIAQRLDLRLALPAGPGAYPVLAEREDDSGPPCVALALDRRLAPLAPLPARAADRHHIVRLTGDHTFYRWGLDLMTAAGASELRVRQGERIEITLSNATTMSHPMHLHGHRFELVAIDGLRLSGPLRDTVLVPPAGAVTVAFDADNPGAWAFHCHHLYHMVGGMMTAVRYET